LSAWALSVNSAVANRRKTLRIVVELALKTRARDLGRPVVVTTSWSAQDGNAHEQLYM